MSLYRFEQITSEFNFLGGKGYTLGLLKNAGFVIPDGVILTTLPESEEEWNEIISWWISKDKPKLAIRSSAIGEDSSEQSFAGQNSTYLNVRTEAEIKSSIEKCFNSIHKTSSKLYHQHFLGHENKQAMNVVLQTMVDPLYSGVFFSVDPRNNQKGWIVEALDGLGEDLVSGKKNPWHFEENKLNETTLFNLTELVQNGNAVRDFLGVEIDMEWSIDKNNKLQILQARPITALSGKSGKKRLIDSELSRLHDHYPAETVWDGGTFAEWNGPPSELTFSIWRDAFKKQHAFSKALKKLGYLGIDQELTNESHSLLERIFNRGYVNISMLAPLYFGPIPYKIHYFNNKAKLKFDFKKMTFKTFILTPFTIFRMLKVGLALTTRRSEWIKECAKELVTFSDKSFRVKDSDCFKNLPDQLLFKKFNEEVTLFYDQTLMWPLVLITLIESTTQSLKALLKGVYENEEIDKKMNEWMAIGLHTVTMDMNNAYRDACGNPDSKIHFLEKYGHRGPGELELAQPRWTEIGMDAFMSKSKGPQKPEGKVEISVEDQIHGLTTYKKQVIEKEWYLLKEMLELREKWKMQLLSPYSHIRYAALEIGRRFNVEDKIFWFSYQEISNKDFDEKLAEERKAACELSKSIYLPPILELSKLEKVLSDKVDKNTKIMSGVPLSPGVVYGEVRVVIDPTLIDTDNWPENTILVAESTDPGWTGLFIKSKAIIVEKGGVLSHCAIVAREMSLPAVSGIKQCHLQLVDGDKIWVDGNNGRITIA